MRGLLYTTSITCSFLLYKHKLHFSVALQSVIVNQKRPVCSAAAHWQQPNCHQPLKERPSSVRAASIRKCRQFLPSSYSHPVSGHQAWYAPAAKADARVSSLSIGLPSQAAVPAQLTLCVHANAQVLAPTQSEPQQETKLLAPTRAGHIGGVVRQPLPGAKADAAGAALGALHLPPHAAGRVGGDGAGAAGREGGRK